MQQRQGEVAHGGGEAQGIAIQGQRVGAVHTQAHRAQVCAGMGHQALGVLPALAGQFQVHTGVQVHIAYPAPHGHVGVPLVGVVADEVGDHRVQAVEGLKAGVGVGAGEGEA